MEENLPKEQNQTPKEKGWLREIIEFVLIAVFIVVPFRIFIAQPFIVSGDSMDPTFLNGEYLIVDQISYRFEEPKRDSVVIFRYPLDTSKFFIKRIIALPGDRIQIQGGAVWINNVKLPESYIASDVTTLGNVNITLKPDEYFVLGDNRPRSSDSRVWGILPRKDIIGRPVLRLFPLNEIGVFPGDFSKTT